jgi:hypothetical protein
MAGDSEMPTQPEERRRLAVLMDERRLELGMRWQEVADAGSVSLRALNNARTGDREIRPLTRHGIEKGLKWAPGSIERFLSGDMAMPGDATQPDPAPAPRPAFTMPPLSLPKPPLLDDPPEDQAEEEMIRGLIDFPDPDGHLKPWRERRELIHGWLHRKDAHEAHDVRREERSA